MQKANIIKKIITGAILVVALVIFFSASKHRLPAPENLVAQVYIPKTLEKQAILSFSFNAAKDYNGNIPKIYKIEIKNKRFFSKNLFVYVDANKKIITKARYGKYSLNPKNFSGSKIEISGNNVVTVNLMTPPWLSKTFRFKEKLSVVTVRAVGLNGELGKSVQVRASFKTGGGGSGDISK